MNREPAIVPSRLLSREPELARIAESLGAAARGSGGLVLVEGPAGIGKTSLLRAARDLARHRGLRWLSASGGELEGAFAFGVVRQLFEPALHALGTGQRRALFAGAAARARSVLGNEEPASALRTDGESDAVIHALYWFTVNLMQATPLLLAVDDLQWVDSASRRFLVYVARRIADLPLALMVTSRPPLEARHAEILRILQTLGDTTLLRPSPLCEADVAALLAARHAGAVPRDLAATTHRVSAGNPLFCLALIDDLALHGAAAGWPAAALEGGDGMRSLMELVLRRLGALDGDEQALMRALAVLGADADMAALVQLSGLAASPAVRSFDALAARGLIKREPAIAFEHPIVRQAVLQCMPPARRQSLHAQAAGVLLATGLADAQAATHLLSALPSGEGWRVALLRRVAARVRDGDPASAQELLARARAECVAGGAHPSLFGQILHEEAVASLQAGDPAGALPLLRSALARIGAVPARAPLMQDLALALSTLGEHDAAVRTLQDLLDETPDLPADARMSTTAQLHQYALMGARHYAAVAARLDATPPDPDGGTPGARALLAALATEECLRTGSSDRARAFALSAFRAGLLDDHSSHVSLWGNAAFPLLFADACAEADTILTRALDRARAAASLIGTVRVHTVRACLRLRQGAVLDAESDARLALELAADAGLAITRIALGVLIEALVEKDDLAAAEQTLRAAGQDTRIGDGFLDNWVLHARAWLRLAQSKTSSARADFAALDARGVRHWRPWNPAMFCHRGGLIQCLLLADEHVQARALAAEDLARARAWGAPRAVGLALRHAALVADWPAAQQLLRDSAAALCAAGARLEHARSLHTLGALQRAQGQRQAARASLSQAMSMAHACGGARLVAQAREELVISGARPRRAARLGVAALTPSELRVARLACEGRTNRAIAQALFITLRTVEMHLTHVYQKLEIDSREALTRALER